MSGGVNHWGEAERRAERFGQPVWRGGDEAPYVAVDGYEGCEGEKMPPHVRRDEDGEVVAECCTLGQAEQVAAMLTAALGDQPGYALCGGYPGAAVIPEPPSDAPDDETLDLIDRIREIITVPDARYWRRLMALHELLGTEAPPKSDLTDHDAERVAHGRIDALLAAAPPAPEEPT